MMEQRNEMLRELQLNKKESLGIVSIFIWFGFVFNVDREFCLCSYLTLYLLCKVSSLVEFKQIAPEEKLPLVIFAMCD